MAQGSERIRDEADAASPAGLNAAILDVASALDLSRAAIERGELIDLSRIETRIAELCAIAQARPADQIPALKPGFVALIAALEALRLEIVKQHQSLQSELQDLSARQRASTAYRGPARKGR